VIALLFFGLVLTSILGAVVGAVLGSLVFAAAALRALVGCL